MIWLVLRRQRTALILAAGLVALLAAALVVGRLLFVADVAELGLERCTSVATRCDDAGWFALAEQYGLYCSLTHLALLLAPLLLGLFAGAGLFGQELDRGTHVFALTQGVGRVRWWGCGLLVAGSGAALAAAALSALAGWALAPFRQFGTGALLTPSFESSGLVPVAYTVLAFTVAAGAGLLLRSTPAAIIVAAVVQGLVLFILVTSARPQYLPPETARTPVALAESDGFPTVPEGSWQLGFGYLDDQGRPVDDRVVFRDCAGGDFDDCLQRAGIAESLAWYQPSNRYWPFQIIETGVLAALSTAALALAFVGLRRRVH